MVRESTIRSQWILFLDFARFPETEPLGDNWSFFTVRWLPNTQQCQSTERYNY